MYKEMGYEGVMDCFRGAEILFNRAVNHKGANRNPSLWEFLFFLHNLILALSKGGGQNGKYIPLLKYKPEAEKPVEMERGNLCHVALEVAEVEVVG